MLFGTVGSPPNCADMDGGRRTGNHADYRKFLKLAQYFNCIGFIAGYPVEPVDIHASLRHLESHELAHLPDRGGFGEGAEAIGLCSGRDARTLFYATVERVILPRLGALGLDASWAWQNRHARRAAA